MKILPTLAAVAIAMALVLSPMVVNAAGSITFSSPASGASYKGSQSYTISGTISPAPTQADSVGLVVTSPTGQTVDQDTAAVTSGAFSYATAVGGSSAWTTGTYTITGTDSFGATGSAVFAYTATTTSFNQTQALLSIEANLTSISNGIKSLNASLTAIKATQTSQGTILTGLQTSLASVTTSLTSLTTSLASLTTSLSSVSTTVSGLQTSMASLTTTLSGLVTTAGSINTAVGNLGTQVSAAATNAQNAANAVSSTQTYVLVVAALAAITLVLELAILVRKLS